MDGVARHDALLPNLATTTPHGLDHVAAWTDALDLERSIGCREDGPIVEGPRPRIVTEVGFVRLNVRVADGLAAHIDDIAPDHAVVRWHDEICRHGLPACNGDWLR